MIEHERFVRGRPLTVVEKRKPTDEEFIAASSLEDSAGDWWGFHESYGWLYMDRTLPCNRPEMKGVLIFIACLDEQAKRFRKI